MRYVRVLLNVREEFLASTLLIKESGRSVSLLRDFSTL